MVGRIAAIHNDLHLEVHKERTGFFGLLEFIDDREVSRALLDTAAEWLLRRGLETMRGPASFSLNEEAGLLVDGFDGPPVVMMTYNPQWYATHLEAYGLVKTKDLLAYWFADAKPSERLLRMAETLRERYNITLRTLDKRRFTEEVAIVKQIYNEAWRDNWGHIPMTDAELDYLAKQLKPVVEPRLVVFGYVGGELAGFGLAIPDFNVALKRMNGSLFPFGWAKALWYARRINTARVIILGVFKKFRRSGVAELIEMDLIKNAATIGIHHAEFSWILEDNMVMRTPLEKLGARVYRTYRIYDVAIGTAVDA